MVNIKTNIQNLSVEISSAIEKKYEPVEALNKLNFLLDAHFEDVWEMINLPLSVLQGEPAKDDELSVKIDFY